MSGNLKDAVIVACGRTPIAKAISGTLKDVNPVDIAGQALRGTLERVPALPVEMIDDVIVGCAKQFGKQSGNLGRLVALRAELPFSIPGQSVNRFCSSGLQTIASAANAIMAGQAKVIVAGGMEQMTRQSMGTPVEDRNEFLEHNGSNAYIAMGITAENVAKKYHLTRRDVDEFAAESQRRAAAAREEGKFAKEIIPVKYVTEAGETALFEKDEGIRPGTTVEKLAGLKTSFAEDGVVTAGNSSQLSDAASFAVLMERELAESMGIRPLAKFLGFSVAGLDPAYMGLGPIEAVPKVMKLTGLTIDAMDVIELNEAFATQSLACIHDLNLDTKKTNPNGGAIALGHPLGATGAILTCKALNELDRIGGHYGLITMCIGGGIGAAAVFERL